MAGGTGGHVFPALAVANELRNRGVPVVWLGTQSGIEARLVSAAGYPIEWLNISGLRGKGFTTMLLAPVRLFMACLQAVAVLNRRKPCAVLGMGGFVSAPGGLMAWLLRKPLLIHEQNAVAGLTNRLLALFADQILEAFPGTLSGKLGKKVHCVGNPVREEITALPSPETRLKKHEGSMHLLVVGGSLGAARLNELIPEAVASIDAERRPKIIHQTGSANPGVTEARYKKLGVNAVVKTFIDDMAEAYSWADLVICRAGAMTVFELAAAGLASILVPYPFAVDDHQTANADYLEKSGAALVRQQNELDSDWLGNIILQMSQQQDRLLSMAKSAREKSKPRAALDVAEHVLRAGGIT